jgi:hypothetical protein
MRASYTHLIGTVNKYSCVRQKLNWGSFYFEFYVHIKLWFAVSEVSPGSHDGNGKRSAGQIERLRVQKIYWSHGQLLARLVWTARPTMKEISSPRYTVTWWSGQCQGPGITTPQPHSQLAATTEVCYHTVVPFETFISVFLWNPESRNLIFNF